METLAWALESSWCSFSWNVGIALLPLARSPKYHSVLNHENFASLDSIQHNKENREKENVRDKNLQNPFVKTTMLI